MARIQRRTRTALLLLAGMAAGGVAAQEGAGVRDGDLQAFVDQRIQEWQPTRAERHLDEVGWCQDIRHAERLAREHGRPVLLFTHDGRMGIGRC
jgi:hypothetical protein